jgi:hypothetical protein
MIIEEIKTTEIEVEEEALQVQNEKEQMPTTITVRCNHYFNFLTQIKQTPKDSTPIT